MKNYFVYDATKLTMVMTCFILYCPIERYTAVIHAQLTAQAFSIQLLYDKEMKKVRFEDIASKRVTRILLRGGLS